MKLFDEFEIVKCPEENSLYVTNGRFLYYVYIPEYKLWKKHKNAGNERITVDRYPDVTEEEIKNATGGVIPRKETDFMRLCHPSQLWPKDMFDLLEEDYPDYFSDLSILDPISRFLSESNIRYKSYLRLKKIFDNAVSLSLSHERIQSEIKELSYEIIGRDIFKKEIGIVDGHDPSSYFWIMPVRVIDYSDTNETDNVSEMRSAEISIEEDDIDQYLKPFLRKHFDNNLKANKKRVDNCWEGDDEDDPDKYVKGFEWYLTYNFYSFDSVLNILGDIRDTIDALSSGKETEYTAELKEKSDTDPALIVDFYHRFTYRMEYMIKIGKEKGYDLISFMGP